MINDENVEQNYTCEFSSTNFMIVLALENFLSIGFIGVLVSLEFFHSELKRIFHVNPYQHPEGE